MALSAGYDPPTGKGLLPSSCYQAKIHTGAVLYRSAVAAKNASPYQSGRARVTYVYGSPAFAGFRPSAVIAS